MILNTGLSFNLFGEMTFYNSLTIALCEDAALRIKKKSNGNIDPVVHWFGNLDVDGKNALVKKIGRFRADLNLVKIQVSEAELKKKKKTGLGTGARPGGLAERQDYDMTSAMNRLDKGDNAVFKYTLNDALYHKNPINTGDDPADWEQTWYANFVHEHSHAFLGTYDCKRKSTEKAIYGAKSNFKWVKEGFDATDKLDDTNTTIIKPIDCASCWGFFFEDLIPTKGRTALSKFIKACRLGMWPADHAAKVKTLIKQWQ
jgi:hypothetical protein